MRRIMRTISDNALKYSVFEGYHRKTWKEFIKSLDVQGWVCYGLVCLLVCNVFSKLSLFAYADNFTDIFYTQSFRGSFEWLNKLDWIGQIMQAVISIFSVLGVSLVAIRIMTSILYLSSKGLWDEVSDLKESGGESDYFDFGLINMAKSWAKGKAGTGLDAIIGAVLILLPNIKSYSDFGPKAGGKFEEDISVSQYMLKIALPTVMIVFFCAMGFNGTMWKALAVTVDALGTMADKAVSVNYAGFIDDLVASGSGYKFTYDVGGTYQGKLEQSLAKDLYGRAISRASGANASQLSTIGQNVKSKVDAIFSSSGSSYFVTGNDNITSDVSSGLSTNDLMWDYLGYDIIINSSSKDSSSSGNSDICFPMSDLLSGTDYTWSGADTTEYIHVFIKQTKSFAGGYFKTS